MLSTAATLGVQARPCPQFGLLTRNEWPESWFRAKERLEALNDPCISYEACETLCREALDYQFGAVCVHGSRVEVAATFLEGAGQHLAAVVGFPLWATCPDVKAYEARACLAAGASELDVVVNLGWVKDGQWGRIGAELDLLREAADGSCLKLILETCYLENKEKRLACILARDAGWDYVKTSTGFGTGGASLSDVALMRESAGAGVKIKASGGIRDYQTAMDYLQAGVSRIGTSSGPAIVMGEKQSTT